MKLILLLVIRDIQKQHWHWAESGEEIALEELEEEVPWIERRLQYSVWSRGVVMLS